MADQKIENLLELSLDVDEQTREKSENLQVGYDTQDAKWEIILRYSGEMGNLSERYENWVDLLGGFAIAEVTREQLLQLSEEPLVEFMRNQRLFLLRSMKESLFPAYRRYSVHRIH